MFTRAQSTERLTDSEAEVLKVGRLAEGIQPGVNKNRWVFWRRRLKLLGEESEHELKRKVHHAAMQMKELEEEHARKERRELRHGFTNDWLATDN